jgi:hypothetical protein
LVWRASKCWTRPTLAQAKACRDSWDCGPFDQDGDHPYPYHGDAKNAWSQHILRGQADLHHAVHLPHPFNTIDYPLDLWFVIVFENDDLEHPRIVLRPQELSNNPGVIRRLGVITINTVLEMDIFGCANSTHVCGSQLMNGVGGSGDFTRNAYLSFLVAPSIAKAGRISSVVPMVSHVDHNEHSVQVLVTEQGLADLRGLGPITRARTIIDNCAHPMYREYLHEYLEKAPLGHIRHDLRRCFELHQNLIDTGSMLPMSMAGLVVKGREEA